MRLKVQDEQHRWWVFAFSSITREVEEGETVGKVGNEHPGLTASPVNRLTLDMFLIPNANNLISEPPCGYFQTDS
jgi:hypothetical protein